MHGGRKVSLSDMAESTIFLSAYRRHTTQLFSTPPSAVFSKGVTSLQRVNKLLEPTYRHVEGQEPGLVSACLIYVIQTQSLLCDATPLQPRSFLAAILIPSYGNTRTPAATISYVSVHLSLMSCFGELVHSHASGTPTNCSISPLKLEAAHKSMMLMNTGAEKNARGV